MAIGRRSRKRNSTAIPNGTHRAAFVADWPEFGNAPTIGADDSVNAARAQLRERQAQRDDAEAALRSAAAEVERLEAALAAGEVDPTADAKKLRNAEDKLREAERTARFCRAAVIGAERNLTVAAEAARARIAKHFAPLAREIVERYAVLRAQLDEARWELERTLVAFGEAADVRRGGDRIDGLEPMRGYLGIPGLFLEGIADDRRRWTVRARRLGLEVPDAEERPPLPPELRSLERNREIAAVERRARLERWALTHCPYSSDHPRFEVPESSADRRRLALKWRAERGVDRGIQRIKVPRSEVSRIF